VLRDADADHRTDRHRQCDARGAAAERADISWRSGTGTDWESEHEPLIPHDAGQRVGPRYAEHHAGCAAERRVPASPAPNTTTSAASTTGTQRVAATNDDLSAARPATTGNLNSGTAKATSVTPTSTQTGAQPGATSVTAPTNESGPSTTAAPN